MSSTYSYDRDLWYPTTPAEYGRMLREEAERLQVQLAVSFHYGPVPSVYELAERVAVAYETRQGPDGMQYRRKPVEARW